MRFRLVPTDDKFFELFSQSAANVARRARALQALLAEIGSLPARIDVIMRRSGRVTNSPARSCTG
jgi:hypothetical protein